MATLLNSRLASQPGQQRPDICRLDFIAREIVVGAPSTQWWINLSTAIAFGLGFATILTLVVTPAMLLLVERMAEWRRRTMPKLRRRLAIRQLAFWRS